MDNIRSITAELENSYVQQARIDGQAIVGYACLSTPREVLDAAGIFPYRLPRILPHRSRQIKLPSEELTVTMLILKEIC